MRHSTLHTSNKTFEEQLLELNSSKKIYFEALETNSKEVVFYMDKAAKTYHLKQKNTSSNSSNKSWVNRAAALKTVLSANNYTLGLYILQISTDSELLDVVKQLLEFKPAIPLQVLGLYVLELEKRNFSWSTLESEAITNSDASLLDTISLLHGSNKD